MEQRDVVAALEGDTRRVAAQEVRPAEEEDLHARSLGPGFIRAWRLPPSFVWAIPVSGYKPGRRRDMHTSQARRRPRRIPTRILRVSLLALAVTTTSAAGSATASASMRPALQVRWLTNHSRLDHSVAPLHLNARLSRIAAGTAARWRPGVSSSTAGTFRICCARGTGRGGGRTSA